MGYTAPGDRPRYRILVTEVIEEDDDRVLLAGRDSSGERVTFHLRMTPKTSALISKVRRGEPVEAELQTTRSRVTPPDGSPNG